MKPLERTRLALEEIKDQIELSNKNSLVESFLVQYLLILFYSEVEESVSNVIRGRLHFEGDEKLQHFVFNTNEGMIKRIKKSEIKDVLKKFNCDREQFEGMVNDEEFAIYSTLIANRHEVAHGRGSSVTISQFAKGVDAAERILSALSSCIK